MNTENDNRSATALETAEVSPRKRGFGAMDPEKQRAIARKGGKSAHAQGRAHQFGKDEARAAGQKGGHAVSKNREHMAAIGRAGGLARGRKRAERLAHTSPVAPSDDAEGQRASA
jgi:general stress protein YciG